MLVDYVSGRREMKQLICRWGPAVLVMGLIFAASSTSGSEIPDFGYLDYVAKKGGHLIGYALLGAAFIYALNHDGSSSRIRFFTAGILAFLYAVTDEWHQSFVPGRNPDARDICIDMLGAILGIALMYRAVKFYRSRTGSGHGS